MGVERKNKNENLSSDIADCTETAEYSIVQ